MSPFKLLLFIVLLGLLPLSHAAEKEALPMDLIELLGELDEQDQASLATALEASNKPTPNKLATRKPAQKTETGGQQ
jgi:hypothetical protein